MSCAGNKSEHCEPNFASQAQRWPIANEHDSYEFLRILKKFLRQPCRLSEAQTHDATHDEADSRHYLRMRSFESLRLYMPCILSIFTKHLTLHRGTYMESMWNSAGPEFQKLSKLRFTVEQFVNAILKKHCLPTQFPTPSWSSLSIYWDSVWDAGCWGLWKAHCPDMIKWNHFWHWNIQGVHMPYTGGPAISTVNISRSCAARVDLQIVIAPRLFPSKFGSGNQWTKQRHAESSLAKTRPSPVTLEMQKIGQAWPSCWCNSHTTVGRASAKIKASLSAFEKVDMTMESTARKPANSSEFWLVWTSDQSSSQRHAFHLPAGPPFWRSQTLRFPTGPSPSPPRAAASLRLTSWMSQGCNQHTENVCHPYPRIIGPVRTTIQVPGCQAWRSCAAGASSPRRRSWRAVILKSSQHEAWHLFDSIFGNSGIHTHSELG